MTVEELRASGLIIFEAVCGSQSFGLATPTSDVDVHGVYMASDEMLASIHEVPDVIKSDHPDVEYWEFKKFLTMLRDGKPNALELLNSPASCIRICDERVMSLLRPYGQFVSTTCRNTFHRYAMAQIDKARGQNKKFMNPMPKERKTVLDFCSLIIEGRTVPLLDYIPRESHKNYGLANIDRVPGMYAVYMERYDGTDWPQGFVRDEAKANEVCLSSVPEGRVPVFYLYWNKDGYAQHCKTYKEYWEWVACRSDARYSATMAHGKGYDAKNMMHTFRLLHMGLEIMRGEGVIVGRTAERDYLLGIKSGARDYDDLVVEADALVANLLTVQSLLPEPISAEQASRILMLARKVGARR